MTLHELRASLRRARIKARKYSLAARRSRRLAARRRKQIAARSRGPAAVVKWALDQVGTTEQPAGSNWGPKISAWILASGYAGPVPYCQCGANAAAVHGGAPQLRTGYTPTVLRGIGGYKPIPLSAVRAGDFVYFKWPGVSRDSCDHVGVATGPIDSMTHCVEFNTSPGTVGSQNNGGGVYLRSRPRSLAVGAVRPPYPS